MECTRPFRIFKNLDYKRFPNGLDVPCGKCLACRRTRANEWSMRVLHELNYWSCSCFITLTYDSKHVPDFYSLRKSDLRNFWKRLRKNLKKRKIRYYACGEYGDRFYRPHYHAIIFGVGVLEHVIIDGFVQSGVLKDCWSLGHIWIGSVSGESAKYVAQYIDKKLTGEVAKNVYRGTRREPPFQCCSQGLGYRYAIDNKDSIVNDLCIRFSGKEFSIPRYYRNKLDISSDTLEDRAIRTLMSKYNDIYSQGLITEEKIIDYLYRAKQQKELTLKAKIDINRDRNRKF